MTASPPEPPDAIHAIAAEAIGVLGTGRQIAPFSERFPDLTLAEAYRVTHAVRGLREARGEQPVARKIGFTNRTIWDEYGVHAPIWSFVYDRTVLDLAECGGAFALYGLAEPRIEPEIVFGLDAPPEPGVDAAGLLSAIAWVAPGFEIVQSIFPGWRFSPADTVIGFGLHGALADRGRAQNVLDGPLFALRHVIDVLAQDPVNPPLQAGEIVTTGTLTRALPVRSGETWTAAFDGVPLEGIAVRFA